MPDTSHDPGVLAARARIAAADELIHAAMDEMHRMEEFTGKGDAVADDLYAKAEARMKAAEAERLLGYDDLVRADEAASSPLASAARADRASRAAATPVDALIEGALGSEAAAAGDAAVASEAAPDATSAPAGPTFSAPPSAPPAVPMTRIDQENAAANRDYGNAMKARGCLSPAIIAVIGTGAIAVLVLVLIGSQLSGGPGASGGTAGASILASAAATGQPRASTNPGTTTGGVADFAGRWALVEGLDDPNGYDVAYYYNPSPPPGQVTMHSGSSGYFDIDATGAIVGGQYDAALTSTLGCTSPNQAAPRDFTFDSQSARGQTDAAGNGTVIWEGTKTITACPGGTEQVAPENVTFQFHIAGEQMVICRSNTTAELSACADPYPRRVALFARAAPP